MGRDEILGAVREALGVHNEPVVPQWTEPRRPPIADLPGRFRAELEAVHGALVDARGKNWTKALQALVPETGATGLFLGPGLDLEDLEVPAVDLAHAEANPATTLGIVRASAAIAASGTVVLDDDGAHLPSLVTETSVVVLAAKDIVPYLSDLAPPGPDCRQRVLVTGPSRTADIEKILVLGAHGPRRLVVVLAD